MLSTLDSLTNSRLMMITIHQWPPFLNTSAPSPPRSKLSSSVRVKPAAVSAGAITSGTLIIDTTSSWRVPDTFAGTGDTLLGSILDRRLGHADRTDNEC